MGECCLFSDNLVFPRHTLGLLEPSLGSKRSAKWEPDGEDWATEKNLNDCSGSHAWPSPGEKSFRATERKASGMGRGVKPVSFPWGVGSLDERGTAVPRQETVSPVVGMLLVPTEGER